jgi:hypothetical protein
MQALMYIGTYRNDAYRNTMGCVNWYDTYVVLYHNAVDIPLLAGCAILYK